MKFNNTQFPFRGQNKVKKSARKSNILEIKSELYSILKTTQFLRDNMSEGKVDHSFYIQKLKSFRNTLQDLTELLQPWKKSLLDLAEELPLRNQAYELLRYISSSHEFKYNTRESNWQFDPHQLAQITSEITSHFITAIDYLHIINSESKSNRYSQAFPESSAFDMETFFDLLREILTALRKSETFLPIYQIMLNFANRVAEQAGGAMNLGKIEDELYKIYSNFKRFLENTKY